MPQRYLKIAVFSFFFLVCLLQVKAQQVYRLKIIVPGELEKSLASFAISGDSSAIYKQLDHVLRKCAESSYLTASFDSVVFAADTVCYAYLQPGASYKWLQLRRGNATTDVLSAGGWREEQFRNKIFDYEQYVKRMDRLLGVLEQNGYPFAQITLDSIEADSQGIHAALHIEKNDFIVFDTIEVIGNASIKPWFIAKYTGIKIGNPYNEQLVTTADGRLSQLPFLRIARTNNVFFYGDKARVLFYLENRQASSVDGIIGFAPASNSNNNKLLITGEANLKLQNLFSTGKSLDLSFRSFLNSSQDLRVKFVWPYLFRTNLAFDYELNFLKFDSTFIDVKNDLGLQYRFIGTDHIRVFYSIQTTSLINVDTIQVKLSRSLPASNDLRIDQYGIGLKLTRYDYFLNPRKGFSLDMTAGVGFKKIIRNSTINDLKFTRGDGTTSSIYDTIDLSSVQYRLIAAADYFIPIFSRATVRVGTMGGHIQTQNLFFNELFRIGGIRTLKGFDEQSIFASTYLIGYTELRYLLQQNSNVMLFWNGAWYTNAVRQPHITDRPYGFGAGMNFETGAGIFSVYYAVGKQFNNQVEFDKAKIHFGFVNYF